MKATAAPAERAPETRDSERFVAPPVDIRETESGLTIVRGHARRQARRPEHPG